MQWIVQLVFLILIHWIVIYPMDSAIQLLNNWGQKFSSVGGASYITLSVLRSSEFEFAHQKSDFPTEILLRGANLILRAPMITSPNY